MRRDFLELDSSWLETGLSEKFALHDVEAVRMLLSGSSVVDWQRLAFTDLDHVDRFLATHLLDPSNGDDRQRLRYVYNEAVSYLEEHLHLSFPPALRNPNDVREVFLWASQADRFRRTQILSCVIIKLMHVIHHMEAADLRFRLPIAEEALLERAHRRILHTATRMQEEGLPVVSFYGNRKSRSSVITKLLAKTEAVAATIFDKLRYRIVVRSQEDVLPALGWLAREAFPFNYVIPRESHNNLVDPDQMLSWLASGDVLNPTESQAEQKNSFSSEGYRTVNWIIDFPIRVDSVLPGCFVFEHGQVVFVTVEFQLLDEETARLNEEGDNAHHLYKQRQHRVVASRLKRGAGSGNRD